LTVQVPVLVSLGRLAWNAPLALVTAVGLILERSADAVVLAVFNVLPGQRHRELDRIRLRGDLDYR
jgi:hypothetical protein